VVGGGVDVVHTDSIGSDGLHESSIKSALVAVDQRIVWSELVGNAWKVLVLSTDSEVLI